MKVSKIAAIGMTVKKFDKDEIIVTLAALQKRSCQLNRGTVGKCVDCSFRDICVDVTNITEKEMALIKLE